MSSTTSCPLSTSSKPSAPTASAPPILALLGNCLLLPSRNQRAPPSSGANAQCCCRSRSTRPAECSPPAVLRLRCTALYRPAGTPAACTSGPAPAWRKLRWRCLSCAARGRSWRMGNRCRRCHLPAFLHALALPGPARHPLLPCQAPLPQRSSCRHNTVDPSDSLHPAAAPVCTLLTPSLHRCCAMTVCFLPPPLPPSPGRCWSWGAVGAAGACSWRRSIPPQKSPRSATAAPSANSSWRKQSKWQWLHCMRSDCGSP